MRAACGGGGAPLLAETEERPELAEGVAQALTLASSLLGERVMSDLGALALTKHVGLVRLLFTTVHHGLPLGHE